MNKFMFKRLLYITSILFLGLPVMVSPPPALADSYSQVITDKEQALNWWRQNAEQGDANAQHSLAKMYANGEQGLGISQNERLAFKWFLKAAVQGHVKAQFEVARAYDFGIGVDKDSEAAKIWYREAADQGHQQAKLRIGGSETSAVTAPQVAPQVPQGASTDKAVAKLTFLGINIDSISAWFNSESNAAQQESDYAKNLMPFDFHFGWGGKYWSWWFGALAMGVLTIGFWLIIGSPLGVSSSWDRVVRWREDKELNEAQALMRENHDAVQDAMLAAAIEQFGEDYVRKMSADSADSIDLDSDSLGASARAKTTRQEGTPWQAHLAFLTMLAVGGLLSTLLTGNFQWHMSLGDAHEQLFGFGWHTSLLLIIGGIMIGFGTRMGGGCSSGHGLSGCSRLQPGSLVGTAAFFGTAIAVSILLEVL